MAFNFTNSFRNKVDGPQLIVLYFQGYINILSKLNLWNASSMPSRLPFLSRILRNMTQELALQDTNICMMAPSYRGYLQIYFMGLRKLLDIYRTTDASRTAGRRNLRA